MKLFETVFIHGLIVIILGVNCSCTSMLERKQIDAFSKRTTDYGKLLRWGQYSDAVRMRGSPTGTLDAVDVEPLKEIRVTSYRITSSELSSDPGKGIVYASLDFYHERENRIRTIQDQQSWWYDKERERWYLDGDLPAFITQ